MYNKHIYTFLLPANEVCEGYVFTGVCLSTGGGCPGPGAGGCVSEPALRQTPPSQQTATAADGTHPTGMHSCLKIGIVHF